MFVYIAGHLEVKVTYRLELRYRESAETRGRRERRGEKESTRVGRNGEVRQGDGRTGSVREGPARRSSTLSKAAGAADWCDLHTDAWRFSFYPRSLPASCQLSPRARDRSWERSLGCCKSRRIEAGQGQNALAVAIVLLYHLICRFLQPVTICGLVELRLVGMGCGGKAL